MLYLNLIVIVFGKLPLTSICVKIGQLKSLQMFVVLEGIDGAGKGRQRNEVSALIKEEFSQFTSVEFPDHQGVMYKNIIKPALLEKISIPKQSWFIAFALDQILFQDQISKAKESRDAFFICDGYFTTNIAYNAIVNRHLSVDKALQFADDFDIAEADLNIFIDVDPKVALTRKLMEPGHDEGLDVNERDLEKQRQIRSAYLHMAKDNIFGKWEIIPGNGSINEVTTEIMQVFNKYHLI